VQWLDAASLAALRHAFDRLDREHVGALLAVRGGLPDWLRRSVHQERVLTVGPHRRAPNCERRAYGGRAPNRHARRRGPPEPRGRGGPFPHGALRRDNPDAHLSQTRRALPRCACPPPRSKNLRSMTSSPVARADERFARLDATAEATVSRQPDPACQQFSAR
jgi:hypothetical protein